MTARDRDRTVDAELVEYVIAVLPDGDAVEDLMPAVVGLVSDGIIRLLDGAVVARDLARRDARRRAPTVRWYYQGPPDPSWALERP